jgi:transcriptional regulator
MKHLHKDHREEDIDLALAFIHAHPFATLAVNGSDGPVLAMTPLVQKTDTNQLIFIGHIARNNPLAEAPEDSKGVALFRGTDAYISSSYYRSKIEHGRVVPTWNYTAAELRGRLTIESDPNAMLPYLTALTHVMEANRPIPWKVSDAPNDYISKLKRGIVGIEFRVEDITYARKLSQDKSEQDRQAVVAALVNSGRATERLMAEEMKKDA